MSLLPATLMWTLLATVLAHSHLAYPERNLRSTTTIPDFYHKPDVIIREMQQMCHIHEHMRCEENRNIPYVIVEGVDTSVHDILFAGMHARELSASETALALIRRFSDPNDKPPHNLIIIPIQNKWGMDKVWGGDFAHRKNIHGVDLNRQGTTYGSEKCEHEYPFSGQNDPYREAKSVRGKGPMSEPESKMLLDVLHKFAPIRTSLNTHSGEHSIYDPHDANYGIPLKHEKEYEKKLNRVVAHHLCPACENEHHIGPASLHSTYQAFCTVSDYIDFHDLARFSFTLEVFGDFHTSSIFAAFNPTTRKEFDHTLHEWSAKGGIIDALLSDRR